MRRILAMGLVLSLGVFFQAGCGGVGVRTSPPGAGGRNANPSASGANPWPDLKEPSMDLTPLIVGAVAIAAAMTACVYFKARRDRIQSALTPEGERVRILIHAEAPEDALFLGDIHTGIHDQLESVKNDLRNQTARLGGDLMVLDNIQQDIIDGQTRGYLGIGRAYKARIH
jgi:hypothetical protein